MTAMVAAAEWSAALGSLVGGLSSFYSAAGRQRALHYVQGLLTPVERKNGWQLAEAVGDTSPAAMQDFLGRTRWDADAVRDDLQAYVIEHLSDDEAVLVLDETGFIKKGNRSVGVKRQYSGTAGRIENCQVAVFLGYAGRRGRVLVDRALYLPEEWAGDDDRRQLAGVPCSVAFATKPKLGRAMLERAIAAGLPCRWVAADSVYGGDYALRLWLERQPLGYVLTVTSKQRAPMGFDTVKERTAGFAVTDWQRLSAGDGAKGPRLYDWAYKAYPSMRDGWCRGLLVRRSLSEPDKLTYYLTFAPEGTPAAVLVRVAGNRWTIESCFEAAKGEVGLDQYEVRSWTGWHRHVTLAMLALAFLTVVRAAAIGGRREARPDGRSSPLDRSGNSNTPGWLARQPSPSIRRRYRLVHLAKTAPAEGATLTLETTNEKR
jgi:SRSO17 transposase